MDVTLREEIGNGQSGYHTMMIMKPTPLQGVTHWNWTKGRGEFLGTGIGRTNDG